MSRIAPSTPARVVTRALPQAVAAEWVKAWSVRSTWWCLACAVVLGVLAAATLAGANATDAVREGGAVRIPASEAVVSATSLLSLDAFGHLVVLPPGEVALDLLRTGVYFALVGVMTVGVGVAMRSAAGTLSVVFMLLMGLPLLLSMTGTGLAVEASLRMPMFAELAFMDSAGDLTGGPIPYSAGEGLAWLLAWTAAAMAAGLTVLHRRDA